VSFSKLTISRNLDERQQRSPDAAQRNPGSWAPGGFSAFHFHADCLAQNVMDALSVSLEAGRGCNGAVMSKPVIFTISAVQDQEASV
jgi:hypothetical protein